jgi:hypothetical protein
MLSIYTADHVLHDDEGRMLLFAVSVNVGDGPLALHLGRHRNVASDMFGVSKLSYRSMLPGIATIQPLSNRLCDVRQNRRRRKMLSMRGADPTVHNDATPDGWCRCRASF